MHKKMKEIELVTWRKIRENFDIAILLSIKSVYFVTKVVCGFIENLEDAY